MPPVFNLVCFGIACVFFVVWTIEKYRAYQFRVKYTKALEECQKIMGAYYYMGKEAARIRIKYNILFNTLLGSHDTFHGDFVEFRKWAQKEGLRTFGVEKILEIKDIENHYKQCKDEVSKITNQ